LGHFKNIDDDDIEVENVYMILQQIYSRNHMPKVKVNRVLNSRPGHTGKFFAGQIFQNLWTFLKHIMQRTANVCNKSSDGNHHFRP